MNSINCKAPTLTFVYALAFFACTTATLVLAAEADLIAVLESDAGWQEKQAACRDLRRIGTAKSIDALASLLPEKDLSHMARYALEAMPYPEVDKALRDALLKTKGMQKVGVIISIGTRRDEQAVPLLIPLLKGSDTDIARTAAGALGRIATPEAIKVLFDFRKDVPNTVKPALAEGLLAAGQRLERGGGGLAVTIYQDLLTSSWPMYIRMGAFRGLIYAEPKQGQGRLLKALGGNDPVFRDMAAQIVAETSGSQATKAFAKALPKLPAGGQAALLRGLTDRKDPIARAAVAKAAHSSDKKVKLAAVKALGVIGNAEDIITLAELLLSYDEDISHAAQASLATIEGQGVDAAIAAATGNVARPARPYLLAVLANRSAEQAVPMAVSYLKDNDASVRIAALRLLVMLGDEDQTPAVVMAVKKSGDPTERAAAEKALGAICSRCGDSVLPIILDGMNDADIESRIVLLRSLGRIGGLKAMKTVLAVLDDSNEQIGDEAVRVLSNWPTFEASPHLLKLAQSDKLNQHVLGLRGYVRLSRLDSTSMKDKSNMLKEATNLVKRPEEKKLVVAALGTLPTRQSLSMLQIHLKDEAVRNEAASAIIAIATELGRKDRNLAVEALEGVIKKCRDARIRRSAKGALAKLQYPPKPNKRRK